MKIQDRLIFRIMHPRGRYPSEIVTCQAGMLAEAHWRNFLFSAVRSTDNDEHQSEICWVLPSEIRFWASITLAYTEKPLSMCLYPLAYSSVPFAKDSFDNAFVWKVALHFDSTFLSSYIGELGGYQKRSGVIDLELQQQLLLKIEMEDSVMMRGLAVFLKANVVYSTGKLFMEEATLLMFLAMEAALEVARTRLQNAGRQNPKFEDAIEYVAKGVAPKDSAMEYFRECYDKRVMLVHPSNRVSSDLVPLLWADDFYDNYDVVADLYRRLLLKDE